MPCIRCREYDDNGKPVKNGCPNGNKCNFIHPSHPDWGIARRVVPKYQRMSSDRGRGRGRGGPPSRERTSSNTTTTGSNSMPRGGGSGSNAGADCGWGSRTSISWQSWGEGWGSSRNKAVDKDKDSSMPKEDTSKGWGISDDFSKDADGSKDKGKGKAAEISLGWGQMDVDKDDAGWGSSEKTSDTQTNGGGWEVSSPKFTEPSWKVSEPKDVSTSTRDPNLHEETTIPTKKSKPENIMIPSAERLEKVNVDSPQSSIPPTSATSLTAPKPFLAGPSSLARRHLSPDVPMSVQTSRSGSLVPVIPPPKETRSLRSVKHREAKSIWSEYIELIRQPIMSRLRLIEERRLHKDYKAAQNSRIYVKVGKSGTTILDESMRNLKGHLERIEREYKTALEKLCAFEEGFEFPLHVLTGRKEDVKRMRQELAVLRQYVRDAKGCVENMRIIADDIESRGRAAAVPVLRATSVATDKLQKTQPKPGGISKKEEIEKRFVALKERAADLSSAFLDMRKLSDPDRMIQEKMNSMKASLLEPLEAETDALSERMRELSEDNGSLGRDLNELCSDIVGLYTSLKEAEVAAEQETHRIRESLQEDRQLLIAAQTNAQASYDLLGKSTEHLELLRQELRSFEESKASRRHEQPPGITEELLDSLVAALLPVIRKQLYPDIDSALKSMTSSADNVVQEHNKSQVQALSGALAPVYEMSGQLCANANLNDYAAPFTRHESQIKTELPVETCHG